MHKVHVASPNKSSRLLRTKYFCKVSNGKNLDTVMQLSCGDALRENSIPHRFVLVIDVSGSMENIMEDKNITLLDRIKIFAETFVERMDWNSCLSIVTFSNEASTILKMTQMNQSGQAKALKVIRELEAGGGTNISDGLFEALLTTTRNTGKKGSRDCIILFTDGEANGGIIDPDLLVKSYNELHRSLNKTSSVPISAFTIGKYRPDLLHELAVRLGCEAFYWLNEACDFEADLFIPVCLREKICITDITVHLSCLEGSFFSSENTVTDYLKTTINSTSLTELTYFYHFLPGSMKKHISLAITIPEESKKGEGTYFETLRSISLKRLLGSAGVAEQLNKKRILKTRITFLDYQQRQQEIVHFLELSLATMDEVSVQDEKGTSADAFAILQNTAAYTMSGSVAGLSWLCAQEAFVKVSHEECRSILAKSFLYTYEVLKNEEVDIEKLRSKVKEAVDGMEKIRATVTETLGKENTFSQKLCMDVETMKEKLEFGSFVLTEGSWGRLASMASSISAEMPAASGVFNPSHPVPYMTKALDERLTRYRKFVEKKSKQQDSSKIFKAQHMALSEGLINKRVGRKNESLQELIIRFGGTAVPHIRTFGNNTVLICSMDDYTRKSERVRDAMLTKTPIVNEKFIYDCIERRKILETDGYVLR